MYYKYIKSDSFCQEPFCLRQNFRRIFFSVVVISLLGRYFFFRKKKHFWTFIAFLSLDKEKSIWASLKKNILSQGEKHSLIMNAIQANYMLKVWKREKNAISGRYLIWGEINLNNYFQVFYTDRFM